MITASFMKELKICIRMPIDHSFKRNLGIKLTAWLKSKKTQNYLNHAHEFEYEAFFVNVF